MAFFRIESLIELPEAELIGENLGEADFSGELHIIGISPGGLVRETVTRYYVDRWVGAWQALPVHGPHVTPLNGDTP